MGWDQTNWPGGEFPSAVCAATFGLAVNVVPLIGLCPAPQKDDLEREPLLRGRPVLLVRVDCHAYWVSNAILSRLYDIPDEIDGGLVVRDRYGKPTGLYQFLSHRPPPSFPLSGLSDQACLSIMQWI